MPKLFIVSLGCPKNLSDAEVMAGELAAAGWQLTADEDGADAALVNTCAFLGSAVEESEAEGILLAIAAPEKSVIPVDYILAVVGSAGEPVPEVASENARILAERARSAKEAAWSAPGQGGRRAGEPVRATPSARRLAREAGVSIEEIAVLASGVIKEEQVREFLKRKGTRESSRR